MKVSIESLADHCDLITKGTTPTSLGFDFADEGVPFLRVGNISGGLVNHKVDTLFISPAVNEALKRSKVLPKDVLLSIAGSIGRAGVVPDDAPLMNCNQAVAILRTKNSICRQYLRHWLESRQAQAQIKGVTVTGTIQNLSLSQVGALKIPLPPLPEQRRIATILDQADALRAKRREALTQLDSLTQSIFIEMFGDAMASDRSWPSQQVSEFVAGFESGKSVAAEDENDAASKYRVLKVSAVTSLVYKPQESKAAPAGYTPLQTYFVKAGDLLFSRANTSELIGATAYVSQTPSNMLLSDKLWRFIWHKQPKADVQFVNYLFRQPKFRAEITRRASGTSGSMKNISQEKVLTISVCLPPLNDQKEFANRIEKIEKLKSATAESMKQLDNLFTSLQHRAFRGEL